MIFFVGCEVFVARAMGLDWLLDDFQVGKV